MNQPHPTNMNTAYQRPPANSSRFPPVVPSSSLSSHSSLSNPSSFTSNNNSAPISFNTNTSPNKFGQRQEVKVSALSQANCKNIKFSLNAKGPLPSSDKKAFTDVVVEKEVDITPSSSNCLPKPDVCQEPAAKKAKTEEKSSSGQSSSSSGQSSDWPASLKAYVNDAFSRCVSDEHKDRVESLLKARLTAAYNDNSVWTTDWSREPPLVPFSASTSSRSTSSSRYDRSSRRRSSRSRSRRSSSSSRSSKSRSRSPISRSGRGKNKSKNSRKGYSTNNANYIPLSSGDNKNRVDFSSGFDSTAMVKGNKGKNKKQNKHKRIAALQEYDLEMIARRKERFDDGSSRKWIVSSTPSLFTSEEGIPLDAASAIIGTCKDLEKRYLRLTSAPDASTVRPLHVLKKSLDFVLEKFKKEDSYLYICDQLKAIRQDLTVQCIRNHFTVHVYESHARIALQKVGCSCKHKFACYLFFFSHIRAIMRSSINAKANWGTFTLNWKLRKPRSSLHTTFSTTSSRRTLRVSSCPLLFSLWCLTDLSTTEIQALLQGLTDQDRQDERVRFALEVRKAWSLGNYCKLCRLYSKAPGMSGNIMDWFMSRERKKALKVLVKSYRPSLPISFIQSSLGFSQQDCLSFLSQFEIKYLDKDNVDCKTSQVVAVASS